MSLAAATNWALVFLVTFLSEILQTTLGVSGLFIVYAVFCLLGAMFVWYFVPETKVKSLADIQGALANTVNASAPGGTVRDADA